MAIQISYTDKYGNTNSSAYAKIHSIHIADPVLIYVHIYKDAAARSKSDENSKKRHLISHSYILPDSDKDSFFGNSVLIANSKSPLTEAYRWLKTQNDTTALDSIGVNWTTGTTDV